MACKRSAVRSRLPPPSSLLRQYKKDQTDDCKVIGFFMPSIYGLTRIKCYDLLNVDEKIANAEAINYWLRLARTRIVSSGQSYA
jgi:hypothetical protein